MSPFQSLSQSLTIPDLWQQQAVHALREGKDVVVHAPTGAGKTRIFELFHPALRGQAVFTVPTRALANDKLAEWQARGWDVGIATGDVAHRLDAKVVVATLETQKGRFLQRQGSALLVIDEYQMIADPTRGVNYELAIALAPQGRVKSESESGMPLRKLRASSTTSHLPLSPSTSPPHTQLLLLSGSVANPQDIVAWLRRIGRDAVLVSHEQRPVPLEEIDLETLPNRAPGTTRGWWPRVITNALRADLGPVLLFAPRRNAAEELAQQLASSLPADRPLSLTAEQENLAGSQLSKLLRARVAFHHSGLSFAQRAGLIEPLAKAGELRVVVATMGLAAGINFSMRSVGITGTAYMVGAFERQVQPDELLQMFGRAGRRGLDETGYALIGQRPPRLLDARARQLRRAARVDWPTLIAVMQGAVESRRSKVEGAGEFSTFDLRPATPFHAALELNTRLFSNQTIALGAEHSLSTGPMPCGLWVDMERARFARRGVLEMLNSRGEWEPRPAGESDATLGAALVWDGPQREETEPERQTSNAQLSTSREPSTAAHAALTVGRLTVDVERSSPAEPPEGRWLPALSLPRMLEGRGPGTLCKLPSSGDEPRYGREVTLGTRRPDGTLALAPWLKVALQKPRLGLAALESEVLRRIPQLTADGRLAQLFPRGEQLVAHLSYGHMPVRAWIDSHGTPLLAPPERRELPEPCRCGGRRNAECRMPNAEYPNAESSSARDSIPHSSFVIRHSSSPCPQLPWCLGVEIAASPAHAWRRLGLIERNGQPTRRGIVFSFFQHGEGLAIAAALEQEDYPIEDLIFDLSNLRAGPRFAGDDSPHAGRLAILCQKTYDRADMEGYLEMGVPPEYGAGASEAIRAMIEHGTPRQKLLTEALRTGDIERALIEWRSLLRHIAHAPDHAWERWRELKAAAERRLEATSQWARAV